MLGLACKRICLLPRCNITDHKHDSGRGTVVVHNLGTDFHVNVPSPLVDQNGFKAQRTLTPFLHTGADRHKVITCGFRDVGIQRRTHQFRGGVANHRVKQTVRVGQLPGLHDADAIHSPLNERPVPRLVLAQLLLRTDTGSDLPLEFRIRDLQLRRTFIDQLLKMISVLAELALGFPATRNRTQRPIDDHRKARQVTLGKKMLRPRPQRRNHLFLADDAGDDNEGNVVRPLIEDLHRARRTKPGDGVVADHNVPRFVLQCRHVGGFRFHPR